MLSKLTRTAPVAAAVVVATRLGALHYRLKRTMYYAYLILQQGVIRSHSLMPMMRSFPL